MKLDDIKRDKRYTVTLGYSGQPYTSYIARFCGDLVGVYGTKQEALQACLNAYNERMKNYL